MYACVYIPNFEAWVFQRGEDFSGPLVAVASGKVVAANKSARRAGIEPGITEARATTLCPDVAVRVRDYGLEFAVWEDTLLRIHTTSPFLENTPPPFAWLSPGDPTCLKALVRGLGVCAGVASTRALAQLAALKAAPGNTLVLQKKHAALFLSRFETARLRSLGFDEDMLEQLELLGYSTLKLAATLSHRHLVAQFGQEGDRLHKLLHPENEKPIPLFALPPTIDHGYECETPCTEPGELLPIIEHLAAEAGALLAGQRCQRVALALSCDAASETRRRSRILPQPVGWQPEKQKSLLNAFRILLDGALKDQPRMEVDRIAISLGTLKTPVPRQHTLFQERPSVFTAVRAVHKRFPGAIRRAVIQSGTLFLDEAVTFEPYPDAEEKKRGKKPGQKHDQKHDQKLDQKHHEKPRAA